MLDYRIYFVGKTGHFVGAQYVECADDQEAIGKAAQLLDGQDIQLWQRGRYIATLPTKTEGAC